MSNVACLEIIGLSKRYKGAKIDSLKDICFTINKGDKFGIIGPNGAGKTTLISILCSLILPSSGDFAYFFDEGLISNNELKKKIGFVPQDFSFYDGLTIEQNFEFFGAMYGLSKQEIEVNGSELVGILGLRRVFREKLNTFSGGMKRRVNLAIGMLHKPSILFLDEPTAGVDVQSKVAIFSYLNKVNESGSTIIYTSHHLSEAEDFCSDLAIIDHGILIKTGKLSELLENSNNKGLEDLFIDLTGEEFRDSL